MEIVAAFLRRACKTQIGTLAQCVRPRSNIWGDVGITHPNSAASSCPMISFPLLPSVKASFYHHTHCSVLVTAYASKLDEFENVTEARLDVIGMKPSVFTDECASLTV